MSEQKNVNHSGVLIAHGESNGGSYYATVKTGSGERTTYSPDLKQAIAATGADAGNRVDMVYNEQWQVSFQKVEKNDQAKGRVIKAAGELAASKVSDTSDQKAIAAMISERVASSENNLPDVPVSKSDRQTKQAQDLQPTQSQGV